MSFKKNAVSGTKWTTLSKVVRSVFLLLQVAILTRFLNKADFGLVAMCMFVINFTNIFVDAGFTSAILFKQDSTRSEYSSLYWTNLLIAVILFSMLILVTPTVASFYKEPELINLLPILGINIIFIAVGRLHLTIMQKNLKFKQLAIIDIISIFIGLLVAVIFAFMGQGIYSLIYSTLAIGLSSSIMGLISNWKENRIMFHFSFAEIRGYTKVGAYTFAGQILGFLITEIDTLIIGKLLGASSLGLYDLAKNIASKFYGIISPILTKVLTPLLSRLQKDKSELKITFLKILYLVPYIVVPLYLILILAGKQVLGLLYGEKYTDGSTVLAFMSIFYCINSIYNPIISMQIATGKTKLGFLWAVLCLLIYPAGIFASSRFGIEYVAMSRATIGVSLIYFMWFVQIKPMIDITWSEFLKSFARPFAIFLAISGVFLAFGFGSLSGRFFLDSFLNIALGMTIYFMSLYLLDGKNLKIIFFQLKSISLNK